MHEQRVRNVFLLGLVAAISIGFMAMIRDFLIVIVLAAVFSGLSYPMYQRLLGRLHRPAVAAGLTLLLLVALVVVPLLAVLATGANEALNVSDSIQPRVRDYLERPGAVDRLFEHLPFYERVTPYREQILLKAGEVLSSTSTFLMTALFATTRATALFLFSAAVLLYTMFYFLTDGAMLLRHVLAHVPLSDADKQRMVGNFVSVTRATLKGTILIGLLQGLLGGIALGVVGIEGAVFWGIVMAILSIIPGVGGALVWVPAAIYLLATGEVWRAAGLITFSALVIGSVDNLLRPYLVGQDIRLHELLIFFSTLGGIILFGAMGFILGPILAALFVTVWDMFATVYQTSLVDSPRPAVPDTRGALA